jgi:hypothetical protein
MRSGMAATVSGSGAVSTRFLGLPAMDSPQEICAFALFIYDSGLFVNTKKYRCNANTFNYKIRYGLMQSVSFIPAGYPTNGLRRTVSFFHRTSFLYGYAML